MNHKRVIKIALNSILVVMVMIGGLGFTQARRTFSSPADAPEPQLVKGFFPGDEYYDPYPEELTDVDGTLFFSADDGVHGRELWVSDGTTDGTIMVMDIYPGSDEGYPNESEPQFLTDVNGTLFFSATDGVHGYELWKSDGTTEGTQLIKDIYTGNLWIERGSEPGGLTNINGMLYFHADDGVHGKELWALKVAGGYANCIFLPIIQK